MLVGPVLRDGVTAVVVSVVDAVPEHPCDVCALTVTTAVPPAGSVCRCMTELVAPSMMVPPVTVHWMFCHVTDGSDGGASDPCAEEPAEADGASPLTAGGRW